RRARHRARGAPHGSLGRGDRRPPLRQRRAALLHARRLIRRRPPQARISQKLITSLPGCVSVAGWLNCASAYGVTVISIRKARFLGGSPGLNTSSLVVPSELIAVTSALDEPPGTRLLSSATTALMVVPLAELVMGAPPFVHSRTATCG